MSVISTSDCTGYPLEGQVQSRRVKGDVIRSPEVGYMKEEEIYLSCEGDLYISFIYCVSNGSACNSIQCFRTPDMKVAENISRFRLYEAVPNWTVSQYDIYYQRIGDDPELNGWYQFPLSEEYVRELISPSIEPLPERYFF